MNSFIANLECAFNRLLRTKTPSFFGKVVLFTLKPLSFIYARILSLRNWCYDSGLKKSIKLPAKVVSIGNISVGGTGKTPLLIKLLGEINKNSAVLTRGYRSIAEKEKISIEVLSTTSVEKAGDEALLLKKKFPECFVFSGPNRLDSAHMAMKKDVSLLFLEDGFQHRRLQREYDILVIDGTNLFGNKWCLPAGLLREPLAGISRAHFIVVMNPQKDVEKLLKEYSSASVVGMNYEVEVPNNIKAVSLISGIAQPYKFYNNVIDSGVKVVDHLIKEDHHAWTQKEIEFFMRKAQRKGASSILCTEKDWVKIEHFKGMLLPVYKVELKLKIVFGLDYWNNLINQLNN
jgi:tetraacyldisaccharide 4'-kinase